MLLAPRSLLPATIVSYVKIGIQTRSLNQPLKQALQTAVRLGAEGVEIDARTELPPSELSQTGLRQFLKMLEDLRLRVAAVAFPNAARLWRSQRLGPARGGHASCPAVRHESADRCGRESSWTTARRRTRSELRQLVEALDGDRHATATASECDSPHKPAAKGRSNWPA